MAGAPGGFEQITPTENLLSNPRPLPFCLKARLPIYTACLLSPHPQRGSSQLQKPLGEEGVWGRAEAEPEKTVCSALHFLDVR